MSLWWGRFVIGVVCLTALLCPRRLALIAFVLSLVNRVFIRMNVVSWCRMRLRMVR